MVTRLILCAADASVLHLADWQHADRLEPFILGNLPDGGYAFAVSVRTAEHFVDRGVPQAARTAAHVAMLREVRWADVDAFLSTAHCLRLDGHRTPAGALEINGAYVAATETDGSVSARSMARMPAEVIDGKPRPLYRRVGDLFERWQRGAWVPHETDHVRHQHVRESMRKAQ